MDPFSDPLPFVAYKGNFHIDAAPKLMACVEYPWHCARDAAKWPASRSVTTCLPVSLFSGCVGFLVFSYSVTSFLFALSLFLPSSLSLVHSVCASFHAYMHSNLGLRLVSRETIAIEVSIWWVQGSRVWVSIRVSECHDIGIYYNNRIRMILTITGLGFWFGVIGAEQ